MSQINSWAITPPLSAAETRLLDLEQIFDATLKQAVRQGLAICIFKTYRRQNSYREYCVPDELSQKEKWAIRRRVASKQLLTPRLLFGHITSWLGVWLGSIGLFLRISAATGLENNIVTLFPVGTYLSLLDPIFTFISGLAGVPNWAEVIRDVVAIYWSFAAASLRLSGAYHSKSLWRETRSLLETLSWGYDDPEDEEFFNSEVETKRKAIKSVKRKVIIEGLLLKNFSKVGEMVRYAAMPLTRMPERAAYGGDPTASFAQVKYLYMDGLLKLASIPMIMSGLLILNMLQ